MSRIHEALLKSQREHELQSDTLNGGALAPKELENPVPHNSFGIDTATAVDVEGSVSAAVADKPQAFAQHAWRPDKERLVFMKPEFSPGIEEFRRLRSRLVRERAQRYLKTILITGAGPGEGKTFVAANLALAMSRHPGSRVLVIDADLRKSTLHTVFGMEPVPGLSAFLSTEIDQDRMVRQTPEAQLCIVTAGKHSVTPTELLHSRRMQHFIENMSRSFDWILIDSPPAATVSDSTVLSEVCDGVVLVIAPGTPVNIAQKCCKEIGQKMLGIVLNRAEDPTDYYNYYGYQEKSGRVRSHRATKPRHAKAGKQ